MTPEPRMGDEPIRIARWSIEQRRLRELERADSRINPVLASVAVPLHRSGDGSVRSFDRAPSASSLRSLPIARIARVSKSLRNASRELNVNQDAERLRGTIA